MAPPELSMYYDSDGRFHRRYSAPADIGALVQQALREAKDALYLGRRGGAGQASPSEPAESADSGAAEGATCLGASQVVRAAAPSVASASGLRRPDHGPGQERPTYADALAEPRQLLHSRSGLDQPGRGLPGLRPPQHGRCLGRRRRAIPPALAARFASEGTVQPVWESEGRPVWVGRDMRILPARTRRLIEDRDRGRRFPGCTAAGHVEIHHLDEWARGGATDYDRQISLCTFHHDGYHRGDFTVDGDPDRPYGLAFTTRHGLPITPPAPPPTVPGADPDAGAVAYQGPTGARLTLGNVEFIADVDQPPWSRPDTVPPWLREPA